MTKYNVGWGLTNLCNMNCQFCYSKGARQELTDAKIDDWVKFVDENHQFIDSSNYGTGENSILDDFFKFISYVRNKYPQIQQSVTTNGYIYERVKANPNNLKAFVDAIDEVDVSIDFYNEEKHSLFRGQPRAYNWAINTLQLCKQYDKLTTIVFVGFEETLTKDNIDGLFYLSKKYDTLVRMNIYRPVSNNPEINKKFILSYNTLVNALEYINEKYQIISLSDVLLGSIFTDNPVKENTGIDSIRILPDGSICPSTYLVSEKYRNIYNIKDEYVLKDLNFSEFVHAPTPKECVCCKYEKQCNGGVFDRRILWYDTLYQRDPYCPARLGKEFPTTKFKTSKTGRISVHDDYLPTLFFKAKKD